MTDFAVDSSLTLSKLYMELKEGQIQMKSDIDYIKKDVTEIKDSVKEFHEVLGKLREELKKDNEEFRTCIKTDLADKANLWVEWFCKTIIGGIALAVFGLFIFLVQELIRR